MLQPLHFDWKHMRAALLVACGAAMVFALTACGGSSSPTATATTAATAVPTATVAPTATTAAVAPTATATAVPAAATATEPPQSNGNTPSGTVTVALSNLGKPNFDVYQEQWPVNDRNLWMGIFDGMFYDTINNGTIVEKPSLATAWSEDTQGVTLTIRQNVPWSDPQYGDLTPADVMFTWDRASKSGTKWTRADVFDTDFNMSGMKQVGQWQIFLPWKSKDARWYTVLRDVEIQSKAQFDAKGADYQNLHAVGTGHYKVADFVADDHMTLDAVPQTWRPSSKVAVVKALNIPEEQTRIAMIKTGAADVIQMGLQSADAIKGVQGVRFVKGPTTGSGSAAEIVFSGLYYQTSTMDGKPITRQLKTDLPWVGDPSSASSMKNANLVRQAMAEAIDRQAIVKTILAGQGNPNYVWVLGGPGNPNWTSADQQKFGIPYDPTHAKALLKEAGYPNGFSMNFWIPSGLSDLHTNLCQAMVPMLQAIGIKVTVQQTAYTTIRPHLLARTWYTPWCWVGGIWTLDPAFTLYRYNTIDVWNPGVEVRQTGVWEQEIYKAPTLKDRWDIVTNKFDPWFHSFMPSAPVVTYTAPLVAGPRVATWPVNEFSSEYPRDLWTLTLSNTSG